MFEHFYSKPSTIDRIRNCWLGSQMDDYVGWMEANGYSSRTVFRRLASEMLRGVVEEHGKLRYTMISGAELLKFCKTHKKVLLRQRIPEKRILFLVD